MIIYREQRRRICTKEIIDALRSARPTDRESLRDLLIDFGQLECGVADALPPNHPAMAEMRRVAVNIGRIFSKPSADVNLILQADLPPEVELPTPEGYAYYAVFPESYAQAAEDFYRELRPPKSVVIGIRSIGTSLSAAVAGAIANLHGDVESFTVRPRGHPFNRTLQFDRPIDASAIYLVVDEGPGLSGSSFASVAEALSHAGVPDSRIVFFPSWQPHPAALLSETAQDHFTRHRSIVPQFDAELVSSGLSSWRDFSAGKWRDFLCPGVYPAVQTQHERRKFLRPDPPYILAKFAGFGSRGRRAFDRFHALHDAGFTSAPLDLKNGFLFSAFAPGRPVRQPTRALIDRLTRYLHHIRESARSKEPVPFDALSRMIETNLAEILQIDPPPIESMRALIEDAPTYELDGRMLPHEWIETSSGFLKTDAVDHADDHFFPGPQDIAWDVAATSIEFGLDESFLDRFDPSTRRRVPFYKLAYSVFRLAYCRMAESAVSAEDSARFRTLARRYEAVTRESPLLHHLV